LRLSRRLSQREDSAVAGKVLEAIRPAGTDLESSAEYKV
jgi:hypothetical protein